MVRVPWHSSASTQPECKSCRDHPLSLPASTSRFLLLPPSPLSASRSLRPPPKLACPTGRAQVSHPRRGGQRRQMPAARAHERCSTAARTWSLPSSCRMEGCTRHSGPSHVMSTSSRQSEGALSYGSPTCRSATVGTDHFELKVGPRAPCLRSHLPYDPTGLAFLFFRAVSLLLGIPKFPHGLFR